LHARLTRACAHGAATEPTKKNAPGTEVATARRAGEKTLLYCVFFLQARFSFPGRCALPAKSPDVSDSFSIRFDPSCIGRNSPTFGAARLNLSARGARRFG